MSENRSLRNEIFAWFSPAGGFIVVICFFLPWLEVHCSGRRIVGSGFTFAQEEVLLWLVPAFAIVIIAMFFAFRKRKSLRGLKTVVIFFGCLGLLMMLMTYLSIEQKLSGFIVKRITSHQIKIGLPGTLFGYILSIVAVLFIKPRTREKIAERESQE